MRECGDCQLCCKLVEVPQLDKPLWTRCRYQDKTKGCAVHKLPLQPKSCMDFTCAWLDGRWDDDDRPDKTGVVIRQVFRMVKGTLTPLWAIFVDRQTEAGFKHVALLSNDVPAIAHRRGHPRRVRLPYSEAFEVIDE